jgi:cytochrome c oxidase assembly protein subunit 20
MADDTRQSPKSPTLTDDGVPITKESLTAHPENKPFSGAQWQRDQQPRAPQNANLMAGGTQNTAGGKIPEVSISNAFQNGLTWNDFTSLPSRPCVRDSFMTGIGSGFALGGTRALLRGSVWSACNWAAGGFCIASGVMYQYCLNKRQAEKEGMMRAVEILNAKSAERKAREEARERQKEERRKIKEEELAGQYQRLRQGETGVGKPWWKVW